jgi:E3 ubiquitin-protein ligase HERC1
MTESGALFSWGSGFGFTLGHGDAQDQMLPRAVAALQGINVVGVTSGDRHTLVLAADGSVYAFGLGKALGIGWGADGEGSLPEFQSGPVDEAAGQKVVSGKLFQLTPKRIRGLVCSVPRTGQQRRCEGGGGGKAG